jgi:hypothetical protein
MVRRPSEENVDIRISFGDRVVSSVFLAISVRKTPTAGTWQLLRCTCCIERQQMSYEYSGSLPIASIYLCLFFELAVLHQALISRLVYRYISLRAIAGFSLSYPFVCRFSLLSFAVG